MREEVHLDTFLLGPRYHIGSPFGRGNVIMESENDIDIFFVKHELISDGASGSTKTHPLCRILHQTHSKRFSSVASKTIRTPGGSMNHLDISSRILVWLCALIIGQSGVDHPVISPTPIACYKDVHFKGSSADGT